MPDLQEQLRHCLQGRVCLMGLGNVEYGDDGFGVRLAEKLLRAGTPDVIVAGTAPERCLGRVVDESFDHLVFLDAVEFGAAPGSVVFLDAGEIAARFPQISTHKISVSVLARWVEASGTTRVWLLGVQPESLKPRQQLTPTVQTTLDVVADVLRDLAGQQGAIHPLAGVSV
jgi:hydrogenase maturation protease